MDAEVAEQAFREWDEAALAAEVIDAALAHPDEPDWPVLTVGMGRFVSTGRSTAEERKLAAPFAAPDHPLLMLRGYCLWVVRRAAETRLTGHRKALVCGRRVAPRPATRPRRRRSVSRRARSRVGPARPRQADDPDPPLRRRAA
jgi:hypothetical protein